jgi:hypothetical protein
MPRLAWHFDLRLQEAQHVANMVAEANKALDDSLGVISTTHGSLVLLLKIERAQIDSFIMQNPCSC